MLKPVQFFAIILIVVFLPTVIAQEVPVGDKQPSEEPKKSQIETDEDLATKADKARAGYEALAKKAPAELEAISKQMEEPLPDFDLEAASQSTLEEAQAKLAEVTASLKAAESKAQTLANQDKQRILRQDQIPGELATARSELDEMEVADPDTDPEEVLISAARKKRLTSLIGELEAEQSTSAVRGDLLTQKSRLANREIANLTEQKKSWQGIYETKKAAEASAAVTRATDEAENFSDVPALSKLADKSANLAKDLADLATKMAAISDQEARITTMRKAVGDQKDTAVERLDLLEKAGLRIDTRNGGLLRQQRAELPTTTDLTEQLHGIIRQSTTARIERLELKKRYEALALDRSSQVEDLFADTDKKKVTREEVTGLVDRHHSLFSDLLRDYDSYISKLQTLSTNTQLAADEVGAYSRFLDERLLWIPSASSMSHRDIPIEISSIKDFAQTVLHKWLPFIKNDFLGRPVLWAVTFIIGLYMFLKKGLLKKRLAEIAIKARQRNCITIKPTFAALGLTILRVAPLPLLLGFLAWRSSSYVDVQAALSTVAGFLFFVGLFKAMVEKDGLLPAHLHMTPKRAQHLAFHFRWIYPLDPIFLFLATALLINPLYPESGRLSFFLLMLFTAVAFHCLLRPSKELVFTQEDEPRKAKTLYLFGLLIPVFFAVGFAMGYISSINTLRLQLFGSIWIVLGGTFIGAIFIRWTLVSRRSLARDQAKAKFDAEEKERERLQSEQEGTVDKSAPNFEEVEAKVIDVIEVEEQTTRLIRLGITVCIAIALWNVWQTSLPALSALDKITLWSSAETSGVVAPAADVTQTLTGQSSTATSEAVETETTPASRLSLQDVLGSILVIILTLTAARNLPGLLELTLLQRLSLRAGGNYAVTTTFRYLIIAIGFLIAFGIIGITWSSVKWLAAAVTLGIGFGLQEIFANFVAGIILLYERPIRVGDVVTVGNDSGKVTKIEIRATTIMQFNNRELIVPNKKFITGELLNWTLDSKQQRFDFKVNITQTSKSKEALKILDRLLHSHPEIMKEPEPSVFFTDFAPGGLEFEVKGYVPEPGYLLRVKSELRFQIEDAFEEAGIGISFPQIDRNIIGQPSAETPAETENNDHQTNS